MCQQDMGLCVYGLLACSDALYATPSSLGTPGGCFVHVGAQNNTPHRDEVHAEKQCLIGRTRTR